MKTCPSIALLLLLLLSCNASAGIKLNLTRSDQWVGKPKQMQVELDTLVAHFQCDMEWNLMADDLGIHLHGGMVDLEFFSISNAFGVGHWGSMSDIGKGTIPNYEHGFLGLELSYYMGISFFYLQLCFCQVVLSMLLSCNCQRRSWWQWCSNSRMSRLLLLVHAKEKSALSYYLFLSRPIVTIELDPLFESSFRSWCV